VYLNQAAMVVFLPGKTMLNDVSCRGAKEKSTLATGCFINYWELFALSV
jgi:hypothetical protein